MARSLLFVEDNFLLAELARMSSADLGLEVHTAPSAEKALSLLSRRSFDGAAIDIDLPGGMDGVELLNHLRNRHPRMPAVLTTGYVPSDFAIPSGVKVIHKPYLFEEVTEALWASNADSQV